MFSTFLFAAALAADDPAVDASADPAFEDLQKRVDALSSELEQLRMDALLRDAEALAATVPPPPPPPQRRANAFNPGLTAFADVFGTVGVQDGAILAGSGPWLRSLELDLRADVDPFAKAVAVLALEQEPPLEVVEEGGQTAEFGIAPEEVYVDLVALPAGFSGRIGAFRQPFGVTNRAHPHDWPWPDLPAPLDFFLGEEGYTDVGAVVSWTPPSSATGLTFTAGALRGVLLDPDEETALPEWIGRGEWFHEVGRVDVAVGGSATGLRSDAVLGGDLMIRWKLNSWRSLMLLAEVLSDTEDAGVYAALQVQPTRMLYLGLRGDWLPDSPQLGAYASVYTSEFLRFRVGSTIGRERIAAHAQLTFVWGSHPVEPYWVNR